MGDVYGSGLKTEENIRDLMKLSQLERFRVEYIYYSDIWSQDTETSGRI